MRMPKFLVIGAAIEADIAELGTYEEKQMFLEDLGLKEAGVNKLIRNGLSFVEFADLFYCRSERSASLDFP